MKTRPVAACAIMLSLGTLAAVTPASAHRLDEYLQATTLSVERGHVLAQMRLTPGVAVFRKVFAGIDANGDGLLSATERRAYAEQVLRDLSLSLDGAPLRLRLVAWNFAPVAEMKEGRGEIRIDFDAEASGSNRNRKLVFVNRHRSRISAYLVNCLVPADPNIQVTAQRRNYQQSVYQLDYVQAGAPAPPAALARHPGSRGWLAATILILCAPFAWLWRRARGGQDAMPQRKGALSDETARPEDGGRG